MAREAVDKIREAEENASRIRNDADKKAIELVERAEREGAELLKKAEADAVSAYGMKQQNTDSEVAKVAENAARKADADAAELLKQAGGRVGAAVDLITKSIIK